MPQTVVFQFANGEEVVANTGMRGAVVERVNRVTNGVEENLYRIAAKGQGTFTFYERGLQTYVPPAAAPIAEKAPESPVAATSPDKAPEADPSVEASAGTNAEAEGEQKPPA